MSERAARGADDGVLRFRLILPMIALGGLEAQLGKPLLQFLQPVLAGEPVRLERGGISEQAWPCGLKEKQGLDLDLKFLGKYALYNDGGQLRLSTPAMQGFLLRPVLAQLLGQCLKNVQHGIQQTDFWLELPADGQLSLPIAHGITVRLERG